MDSVLYRKYRPTSFSDVVGQDDVVSFLLNSIEKDSISNAYLLYGSRGVGKTSIARIFAKELGCDDIDVHEIDAASNTSVEDIRDLNESARSMPVKSNYKIYILDEAHMLSKSAFNAFLKTLEEPPKNVIFILATTEQEKLPETIISRCQICHLKRPTVKIIKDSLISVAKKEGYACDTQSATLMALLADGSFRDALVLLQKALLFSDKKDITYSVIEKALGVPKSEVINNFLIYFSTQDIKNGRKLLEELVEGGHDMKFVTLLCIRRVRAVIFSDRGDVSLIEEYSKEDRDELKKVKADLNLLDLLLKAYEEIDFMSIKQLPLEVALLKNSKNE